MYAGNRLYTRVWRPPGSDHFLGAQLYANRILPRPAHPGLACWVIIVRLRVFPPDPAKTVTIPSQPGCSDSSVTGSGVLKPEKGCTHQNCEFLGIDSGSCANVPTSSCRRLGPQTSRCKVAVFIVNFDTQILTEFTNEKVNIATLDPQSE